MAEGRYVISNPADTSAHSGLTLLYDLSSINKERTALATLLVTGNNGAPQDGLAPLLHAEHNGIPAGSVTLNATRDRTGARLIVTDAVNRALAAGEQDITFTISQRGTPGAQRAFLADGTIALAIEEEERAPYQPEAYLRPVWKAGTMTDESIFFLSPEDGGNAQGNLLFTPTKIISARSGDLLTEYREGVDFKVEGNIVTLLPGSKIEGFAYDVFYPQSQEGQQIRTFRFPSLNRFALSPEGAWFQKHQIFFTYEHDGEGWQGHRFGENFNPTLLPKTVERLNSDKPLKIVLFGDSISAGANATARAAMRPYMPSYGDLIATALRTHYGKDNITYINAALGGTTSQWGLQQVDSLVASEKPDLVIIAFGMNNRISPAENARLAEEMMQRVRAQNPQAEFILVAPMQANELWRSLAPHSGYAGELKKLAKTGVFVADVWDAHAELLKRKKYSDTTGNNVNHPNDFLIRVYAQAVAEPLMPLP